MKRAARRLLWVAWLFACGGDREAEQSPAEVPEPAAEPALVEEEPAPAPGFRPGRCEALDVPFPVASGDPVLAASAPPPLTLGIDAEGRARPSPPPSAPDLREAQERALVDLACEPGRADGEPARWSEVVVPVAAYATFDGPAVAAPESDRDAPSRVLTAPGPASVGPGLDPTLVARALRGHRPALARCVALHHPGSGPPGGAARLRFEVAEGGRVRAPAVLTTTFGDEVAACLAFSLRSLRVPRPAPGPPAPVAVQVRFRVLPAE